MNFILLFYIPICIIILADALSWVFPRFERYFDIIILLICLYILILLILMIYIIFQAIINVVFTPLNS